MTKIVTTLIYFVILCSYFGRVSSIKSNNISTFLQQFASHQGRPTNIVSFIDLKPHSHVNNDLFDNLSIVNSRLPYRYLQKEINAVYHGGYILFLVDLLHINVRDIFIQAEKSRKLFVPFRWMLFYGLNAENDNIVDTTTYTNEVENLMDAINIGFNSEIYAVLLSSLQFEVYLIHRNRPQLPLKWELYSNWNSMSGFDRPHPVIPLAMRRKNLKGLKMVTTAVIFNNDSLQHMKNYVNREVDNLSKLLYYLVVHLFEWMNATGFYNTTASWGYLQPDGTYNGMVRELAEGRSEFSGTVFIPTPDRLFAVEYVVPPAPLSLEFIFRKPALASITNIYVLPFTDAVWIAIMALILILSIAIFFASFSDVRHNDLKLSPAKRLIEGFTEVLCCVFQQGTPTDPISVTSRQILLLGLMMFMFLYTAYAANVVALLQSTTNSIDSVAALLDSPLQCGAHDVVYNRVMFVNENRSLHRKFWLKKGLPQGEKFFMSVEEGVRRIRKGMFAFNVEPTAGFDMIQKIFLEHEKCNIGTVRYADFKYPYISVAKHSPFKEALRIGIIRLMESGVQERTNRRINARFPSCSLGRGMFAAVNIMDVAPAFKCLLVIYIMAFIVFAMELVLYNIDLKKNKKHPAQ